MSGLQLTQRPLPRPSLIYLCWLSLRHKLMGDITFCFEDGVLTYKMDYGERER